MRLRRVTHSGAHNLVEHPYRDLASVALVVIIHLTAKHALRSGLAAADNDISSVQRMPPILHPPDIRLVIILVGTCSTRLGHIRVFGRNSLFLECPSLTVVSWHSQSSMACITTTEGRRDTPRAVWMEKVANTGGAQPGQRPTCAAEWDTHTACRRRSGRAGGVRRDAQAVRSRSQRGRIGGRGDTGDRGVQTRSHPLRHLDTR